MDRVLKAVIVRRVDTDKDHKEDTGRDHKAVTMIKTTMAGVHKVAME